MIRSILGSEACCRRTSPPEARAAGIPLPYAGFTCSVAQACAPFRNIRYHYTRSERGTRYDALQVTVQRRFSRIQFLVGYTASRQLSNTTRLWHFNAVQSYV